ncbi:MAG TPA: HTH domain-containing protein, partial [Erysipelothrix sp.]|nr:HTH domain-containing protein [Erysipelothrix sp.]
MNIRQIQILRELYPSRTSVFAQQFAENFCVSERTIRNDVRDINRLLVDYGAEIIRNHNHELTLLVSDDHRFKQFIEDEILKDNSHPVEKEDRVIYLVRKFLLSQTYHKLEDLADELYVSRSTAQNDL